jgi:hypothetical protein
MSKRNKIREQGFSVQQRERLINDVLRFSRKRFKRFGEIILSLYMGEDLTPFFTDLRIARVHAWFKQFSSKALAADKEVLKDILLYLNNNSLLFSDEEHIHSFYNMYQFRSDWRRDILKWKPLSKWGSEQVNELAFYLFCQYPVPRFLYKAFSERNNVLYIEWFIHIGTGHRIRDLKFMPIPFTRKMGHYFLQVPEKFTIMEAMRWAQVKGLNGDDQLAERIAYSWLATKTYDDEKFWEAFIRIVVMGGMFDHEQLTQLIDYVREMKMENWSYTLKGRTLQSLLRQTNDWHQRSMIMRRIRLWPSSGMNPYKAEQKNGMVIMEELTGSKLLVQEGRNMKHCVATYTQQCIAREIAIFSLRKYSLGILTETMATIEVNLSLRRVVQAKGRMNKKISDEARKHLDGWANKNHLSVSPYL